MTSRVQRVLAALLLLGAAPTWTEAQSCLSSTTVTTTAIGGAYRDESAAVADAIQAVLDQAITQSRGLFVTSSTQLWESFRTSSSGGVDDLDLTTHFSHDLSSRFSGFVESYEVLSRRDLGGGVMEVTARVRVCLDQRIAIGLPSGAARDAILNALVDDVTSAGWHVIYDSPGTAASDAELMEFTLSTGVTYVAQGRLNTSLSENYGMISATVTLTMNLLDTRTLQLAHAFTSTSTGVGATEQAALQMAGSIVGTELARDWNRAFLHSSLRERSEFLFWGVRRPGTAMNIAEIVGRVSGALEVEDVVFDAATGVVTLTVFTATDPCDVAREVPRFRRVRTELRSCTPGAATFHVHGD